jgi:hypothetical protein
MLDEVPQLYSLPNLVPPVSKPGATKFGWSVAVALTFVPFCCTVEVTRG